VNKFTLGEMRSSGGPIRLIVYCGDYKCAHSVLSTPVAGVMTFACPTWSAIRLQGLRAKGRRRPSALEARRADSRLRTVI
jgi:hypothetical protein